MDKNSEWVTRETLLQKVRKKHDEDAWQDFVYYYSRYIYNIIRRMNITHHDAEEIQQAVNLKIWKNMPDFEYDSTRGRFRGWICTVTGNEVKMFMRRKKRMLPRLTEEQQEDVRAYLHAAEESPSEVEAEKEWAAHITSLAWEGVRKRFDPKTCTAFELISRGEKPEEVAEKLGISKNSVYVYKKRVQDQLVLEIRRLNRELD